MAVNLSVAGVQHIKLLASRALESEKGISIEVRTKGEAIRLRQLFHGMRQQERKFARLRYSIDDPLHGRTPFDSLETKLEGTTVIFRKIMASLEDFTITDLDKGTEINPEDL